MRILKIILAIIVLLSAYLLFWPVPIDPGSWTPPTAPELTGDYAINDKLKDITHLFEGKCHECEDVAIDSLGRIYGGDVHGKIYRFADHTSAGEEFANTGGRPLGLVFDSLQNLIVADADKGLLSIDPRGEITVLATEHDGLPFKFTDDLEIGADGTIYFTDASYKFGFKDFKKDMLEHRGNGRFLAYDPNTQTTRLLMDDLYFANGVAVAHDQRFVLVNETGKYRVWRYWLAGEKKGQSEIFMENLPFFNDGISQGSDGIFWQALVSPRQKDLDDIIDKPFMRKLLLRLPESLQPAPENYGYIIGVDKDGNILYNLQDPDGAYGQITNVREYNGKLYLGSLAEHSIGVIDRP